MHHHVDLYRSLVAPPMQSRQPTPLTYITHQPIPTRQHLTHYTDISTPSFNSKQKLQCPEQKESAIFPVRS